jgi:HEAT repeat protein
MEILHQALQNDFQSTKTLLKYLGANNPDLRQIMQNTLHDSDDPRAWRRLLHFIALKSWGEGQEPGLSPDPVVTQRIIQSIAEVFTYDKSEAAREVKEIVLVEGLENSEPAIRQSAALLLGLRGDPRAIPEMEKAIASGKEEDQLRAIRILAEIKDRRCGPPLLRALSMKDPAIHVEANRALRQLGPLAEAAWLKALDHPDSHMRWHGARGLGEIGEARHADLLARGLYDPNLEVRWASADVLAQLGWQAVPAVLAVLSQREMDEQFRQAAYHALHGITSNITRERLKPLLNALRGPAPRIEAPRIAQYLLLEWQEIR